MKFEIRCNEMKEAKEIAKELKSKYPYLICKGTGYKSDIYIIELHEDWDKFLDDEVTKDGMKFKCCNCNDGLCNNHTKEPSWNSSPSLLSNRERCFGEEFWSEVYSEKDRHFVNEKGNVLSFTFGEGGFGNRRYNLRLEDGTELFDVGLWHRGTLPKNLEDEIQKGSLF